MLIYSSLSFSFSLIKLEINSYSFLKKKKNELDHCCIGFSR